MEQAGWGAGRDLATERGGVGDLGGYGMPGIQSVVNCLCRDAIRVKVGCTGRMHSVYKLVVPEEHAITKQEDTGIEHMALCQIQTN